MSVCAVCGQPRSNRESDPHGQFGHHDYIAKTEEVPARLADYNTVADRLRQFYEKYPDGTLQGSYEFQQVPLNVWDKEARVYRNVGEKTIIIYTAKAYRHPEDPLPGVGTASEPFPGTNPYTRDSELMNAETSAWGRAILAVGASDTRKGVASREEVQARRGE